MKDLQLYANICKSELDKLGITYGNNITFSINTRAKTRWGQCKRKNYNPITKTYDKYEININSALLDDSTSETGLKNTIIHELLHTCEGAHGHTGVWASLANIVNNKYHYNIKRTSSAVDKGCTVENAIVHNHQNNYAVECPACHHKWTRTQMSSIISNPSKYMCNSCGERLVRLY